MKKILFVIVFALLYINPLFSAEETKPEVKNQTDRDVQILEEDIDRYLSLKSRDFYKIDTKYPLTAGYTIEDGYIYITVKSVIVGSAFYIGFTKNEQAVKTAYELRNIDYILVTFDKKKNAFIVKDSFTRKIDTETKMVEQQNVELLDYKISKGYAYFKIRRKLLTGDKFDFPMTVGKPFNIVFATKETYEAKSKITNADFVELLLQ